MKYITLLVLLSSACMGEPLYVTDSGVAVYCEDIDRCFPKEEVEVIIDSFISASPNPTAISRELSKGKYTLEIRSEERFLCPGDGTYDGRCAGNYSSLYSHMNVGYMECSAVSGLTHELGHLMLDEVYDKRDENHENQRFFTDTCEVNNCYENAAVSAATEIAVDILCPIERYK